MLNNFHTRACLGLIAASMLLGVGTYLFVRGQAAQQAAKQLAAQVVKASSELDGLAAASRDYRELVDRISWRPGTELRRESLNMSGVFAGNDLESINQMFQVSYSGKGYFSLRSFRIEDVTPSGAPAGTPSTLKVSLQGDSILVLEPR